MFCDSLSQFGQREARACDSVAKLHSRLGLHLFIFSARSSAQHLFRSVLHPSWPPPIRTCWPDAHSPICRATCALRRCIMERSRENPAQRASTTRMCILRFPWSKRRGTDSVIEAVGGGWSDALRSVVSWIASESNRSSSAGHSDASFKIAQRISCTLHRENARAILKRAPEQTGPPGSSLSVSLLAECAP